VDVLGVDIALIRMPDDRREWLLPRAMKVAEPRLEESARAILYKPQAFGAHPVQLLFRNGEPFLITRETAEAIGVPETGLLPFLGRGWTGAEVPIATPAEVVASLTILSVQPGSPVTVETVDQATAIGGQAALAIDNARLYQQQKQFSDTMQRSLLPRSVPKLQGLELGDAYESSARVEPCGRARRRHRAWHRSRRGHGNGEVRLSLARSRASRAGRLPAIGKRGGRRRDRAGEVHHSGVHAHRRQEG
jgi:hypothetical protein